MEYAPPPLFKQGPSARVRLVFFVALSLSLLFVDVRYQTLGLVRSGVSALLYPIQLIAQTPMKLWDSTTEYFQSVSVMQRDNEQLKRQHLVDMRSLHQLQTLQSENKQLRKLMKAGETTEAKAILAEIQYDARDPYSRKIIIDKGSMAGVIAGQPVIDDTGVVGQVTRNFLTQSEVTLVTDKYQTIPVQIARNGLRSVAYGGQDGGLLELRFMAANADVQIGDLLTTSGIDGIYPSGLPVAKVLKVERNSSYAFARILLQPLAGVDKFRFVLVLQVDNPLPPPPPEAPSDDKPKGKRVRKGVAE